MSFKDEVRVVGFDDAPFRPSDAQVPLVGVVMRGGDYVEAVLRTHAARDGHDATERIAAAVAQCRLRPNLAAVLVQNLMVAGFNIVDVEALHDAAGIPVVAVARGPPDLLRVEAALGGGAVPQGRSRWQVLERLRPRMRAVAGGRLTLTPVGIEADAADALVRQCTVRGLMPEPLRLAHLIGAGWVLGQSKGQ